MALFKDNVFTEPAHTEILCLRNWRVRTWRLSDIHQLQRHFSESDLWRYVDGEFEGVPDLEFCESHLRLIHSFADQLNYAMATLDTNEAVGSISAQIGSRLHSKTARIDGWVAKPYWGSGISRAVVTAFTDWLFEKHGIVRVYAVPFRPNRASIGTLVASGFQFEGRMRASVEKNGQIMDQMLYAKINPKVAQADVS
jgi:RimJ/RimL family protein N-acetyltransferase